LNQCGQNTHNYIISIKIDKWHLDNKIVLVGDACHATYPFYGQGMNSALEDAVLLSRYINDKSLSRLEAFATYEKIRKEDTNALHQLSEEHLHTMTTSMISPFSQACDILDYQLAKVLPDKWIYEYEMIAHSTISYTTIRHMIKKQNKKKMMIGFFLIASILSLIIQLNNS
jgi:kynurenine 3-monooxygenase